MDIDREIRIVKDELGYVGRFLDGIKNKNIETYKEWSIKKEVLRKKLKLLKKRKYNDKEEPIQ